MHKKFGADLESWNGYDESQILIFCDRTHFHLEVLTILLKVTTNLSCLFSTFRGKQSAFESYPHFNESPYTITSYK